MNRVTRTLLPALAGAVAMLMVVLAAWAVLEVADGIGRDEAFEDCDVDPTLSGLQGYCVVVSTYPGGPAHDARAFLEVPAVRDGAVDDHRFVIAYPFPSEPGTALAVDWSRVEREVVVTDPASGVSATIPATSYATTR